MNSPSYGMGISTSFFTCGSNLAPKQDSSKSQELLLAIPTTNTANLFPISENHLIVGETVKADTVNREHFFKEDTTDFSTPWFQAMDNQEHRLRSELNLELATMKISKPQVKVLLVFSKNDDQLVAWQTILEKLNFYHDLANDEECAKDLFNKHQHHLVVIENQSKKLDAESLCRRLRENSFGSFTTIVCFTTRYKLNHSSSVKLPCFIGCNFYKRNQVDEISVTRDLLDAGFDRVIAGTSNCQEIEDELLQLEAGPLTLQFKFRATQALFMALDRSHDLVQITDNGFKIQFVNKMYEDVTGYLRHNVIGTNLSTCFENEKNEEDAWQRVKEEIQTGKEWKGDLYTRRKANQDLQLHILILPLCDHNGQVHQYIVIGQYPGNNLPLQDLSPLPSDKRKNSYEFPWKPGVGDQRRPSGNSLFDGETTHRRTNSLARIHSMAVEAPITQIINLLNTIKVSSPGASEVLDQILDILRNSELYAPAVFPNRSIDPMLSDFVDGLVTGTGYSHRRASGGTGENLISKNMKMSIQKQSHVLNYDPSIAAYLDGSDSWSYDILALERITAKKPLVHLSMHTLAQFDVCDILQCSQTTLHAWLTAIESHYHPTNPYHNSTHAADVLHATAYFLKKERVKMWMEPIDNAAALLAAIIHDVDHPGRTNAFLVNSNDRLALLYNDTAVLESHHAAFSFKFTVSNESCNIFKNMSTENFRSLRQSIIDMVLATELSKHFEHVNKFISIVTKSNSGSTVNEQDLETTLNARTSGSISPAASHELRVLIKRMMIKVADIINPARETSLCVEWARRISEEYFSQTDEEKRRGLPVVMPHFDRKTCSLPKSQLTFIDYFLMDMCEAWHEFCGLEDVMNNLRNNYCYWQNLRDRGIMKLTELDSLSPSDEKQICANQEEAPVETNQPSSTCMENHLS